MHQAIPCPACGLGMLQAHYEIFMHQVACPRIQVEALAERERRAKAEGWQLKKQLNRLQRQVHRGARRISEGRGGVLAAKHVLAAVTQVLRPSSHERPITS